MDIQSLAAFVAVAEQHSFSHAADSLHLTQPAISKRIANLEQQLSCRLFDRIGRRVELTEAGCALLPRARHILLEVEDTRRQLHNLSGDISGRLSLAASHHISLHRLPALLKHFSRYYPGVTLDLEFAESEVAYDQVIQGKLELAIITLAPHPEPQLRSQAVWQDRLRYVAALDHPLALHPAPELRDLTAYNAILPGSETFTRQLVEQQFSDKGLKLNVVMSTNYLDTIKMMVSIGLGWSLLPETLIDDSLCVLQVPATTIHRPLGFIYHRDRTLSNAAQAFIDLLLRAGDGAPMTTVAD